MYPSTLLLSYEPILEAGINFVFSVYVQSSKQQRRIFRCHYISSVSTDNFVE